MADDFISNDDKELFRQHMRAVKPLPEKTKRIKKSIQKPIIPPRKIEIPESQQQKKYYLSDVIQDTVLSDMTLSYFLPGLPKQRFNALKNGHIPWEARLDLHGLNSDAARDSLCQFIQNQSEKNLRCLLIIHGKGGQQGTPPVIKNLVNRWLPQLDSILAFHSALPKDGGTGALYVLLKRNK